MIRVKESALLLLVSSVLASPAFSLELSLTCELDKTDGSVSTTADAYITEEKAIFNDVVMDDVVIRPEDITMSFADFYRTWNITINRVDGSVIWTLTTGSGYPYYKGNCKKAEKKDTLF